MVYKINFEVLKKDADRLQKVGSGGGGDVSETRYGRNIIRIAPPWSEEGLFYLEQGEHTMWSDNKDLRGICTCPRFMSDGEVACPIDEVEKWLEESGLVIPADVSWRTRFLFNAVSRDTTDWPGEQQVIIKLPMSVARTIISRIAEPDLYGNPLDPDMGADFLIEKKKEKKTTSYTTDLLSARPGPIFADEEKQADYLENLINLKERFTQITDKWMANAHKMAEIMKEAAMPRNGGNGGSYEDPSKAVRSSSQADRTAHLSASAKKLVEKPGPAPDCWTQHSEGHPECVICVYEEGCLTAQGALADAGIAITHRS